MVKPAKMEAVYLVDESTYLYVRETRTQSGFAYEAFDKETGNSVCSGVIGYEDMLENPIRDPLACARVMAIEECGLDGVIVAKVAISTLDQMASGKKKFSRKNRDVLYGPSIRFITSNYEELFRIPDGGTVEIQYPNRKMIARCEYVDDYHANIGGELFHICQFAEVLEHGGGNVRPEQETLKEQMAWQVGNKEYLAIRITADGWDYTVLDKKLKIIGEGQIDGETLSMLECRDTILANLGWQKRNLVEVNDKILEELHLEQTEKKKRKGKEDIR